MTEMQEFVTKLSDGFSVQTKTINKFWLVLIISSIIALVGRIDENKLIELPFTLGKVHPTDFYSITIILISVVTIAFSAAMTQAMRTRMLIEKAIEGLDQTELYIGKIHIRDYHDCISTPAYIRVAPISQFILGRNQFFGAGKQNKLIRGFATLLYVILKLATFIFLYFIPAYVLNKCWTNKNVGALNATLHIPDFLLFSLIIIAAISMLIVFIGDIKHMIIVVRKVLR